MKASKNYLVGILVLFLLVGLAIWYFKLHKSDSVMEKVDPQEYTELQVVQFYLHMPTGDFIIGRSNSNFDQLMDLAKVTVTSATESGTDIGPLSEEGDGGDSIQSIKSGAIALAIWLVEPQKISTRVKVEGAEGADKHGNMVLETDRILIALGGKYQGKMFVRDVENGNWQPWSVGKEEITDLVEVVRKGGL